MPAEPMNLLADRVIAPGIIEIGEVLKKLCEKCEPVFICCLLNTIENSALDT
ncbi:MAG TPA: hypothetical protein VMC42_09930 [Methanoregulaceae archaeon]|nr:hypothetical protein [Methanoregulaceae archaeon]